MTRRRVVQVGAGSMGRAWLTNLKAHGDLVEVVGLVDVVPEVAERAARHLGLEEVQIGADLRAMLQKVRPDFVVDVTVPEAHRDVTVTALEQGLPVLGEKPMAHTIHAAREMVAAADAAGQLYMVSQSRRYDARLHAYKRLIDAVPGAPGILKSDFYIGAHFDGFRAAMDSPLVFDMAIHTFDAARFLLDADAVSVWCEEFNPSWSWFAGDAAATAVFQMSTGARYIYSGCWCADGRHTSWEADWRAVGPGGTATWDGSDQLVAERPSGGSGLIREFETARQYADAVGPPAGIAGSLREFLDALDTGTTPMGECHDNIKSLAMVLSAMESSRTGRRVEVASA